MSSSSSSNIGRDVHWQRLTPGPVNCNIDVSFSQYMNFIYIVLDICMLDSLLPKTNIHFRGGTQCSNI